MLVVMDWGPLASVGALVAIAAGIAGFMFKRSIQHLLDRELERLRALLRTDEEKLKAELRAQEEAINALRAGALSGMADRHRALDARRIKAIESVWTAAVHLESKFRSSSKMIESLKMDAVISAAEGNSSEARRMQQVGDMLWKAAKLDEALVVPSDNGSPAIERLFVSDYAWALFTTYQHVMTYPVLLLGAVRTGLGSKLIADPKPLLDMVTTALPQHTDFVIQYGVSALPHLVDQLRDALLAELNSNLTDSSSDKRSVERAAEILRAADKVVKAGIVTPEVPASLRQ